MKKLKIENGCDTAVYVRHEKIEERSGKIKVVSTAKDQRIEPGSSIEVSVEHEPMTRD